MTHWYGWIALMMTISDATWCLTKIVRNAWSDARTGRSTSRPIVALAINVVIAIALVMS